MSSPALLKGLGEALRIAKQIGGQIGRRNTKATLVALFNCSIIQPIDLGSRMAP